jgi:23S rRNA pseudouridine1911/1915/1917 synthase
MNKLQVIIPERLEGERIDVALAEMLPELSRSKITNWIKSGYASISSKTFKPKDRAIGNQIVDLIIIKNPDSNWFAEDISINVIYEDEHIIVINKQAGVVTHPGPGNWRGTLANALLNYDPNLKSLDRAGIVHRLDKNTSGLMVVARNQKAQKYLVGQLQNHSVTREYSAIVYGHMISGGTINQALGRDVKDRLKQAVVRNGRKAITHYRVVDRFKNHTHIKAILETGRTHQIRVHLSHIGHALIGDFVYGGKLRYPKKASEDLKIVLSNFRRQALHSRKLSLHHPETGELMSWKTSLPADMLNLLNAIDRFDKTLQEF